MPSGIESNLVFGRCPTTTLPVPVAVDRNGYLMIGGSTTINGTITANQGTANTVPWPVDDGGASLTVDINQTTPGTTDRVTAGGRGVTVTATPTLTVAGAYGANDFVGTSGTGITFAAATRINAGSGIIESAVLVDYALQSAACELWLFDVTPAGLPADNAAFTITDAGALTCIGVIPFSTYYASALNSVSVAKGLGIAFNAVGATTSIYGALVTRGTPTYASGDISIRLQIMQD